MLGVAGVVSALYVSGALNFIEYRLTDLRFRLDQRSASGGVVVVAIDPKSLRALDVWPWARGYHASVTENLLAAGARKIAFDIDFSSRSKPEEDQQLEMAFAVAGGRLVLASYQQFEQTGDSAAARAISRPLPEFARYGTQALINLHPGSDGLIRNYELHDVIDGERMPTLAAALVGVTQAKFDHFDIDYSIHPGTVPIIPYVDVLTGQFDPELVAGKAVIVGATAIEVGDQMPAPVLRIIPGPLLHALAFESLQQGRALDHAGAVPAIGIALLLIVLLGAVMDVASWRQGLILLLVTCGTAFAASLWLHQKAALILHISPWILGSIGCYASAMWRKIDQQGLTLLSQNVQLRDTESLMSHLVDCSFDAILTIDKESCIEMFNPAAERMFGLSEADSIGMHISEIIRSPGKGDAAYALSHDGQHEAVGRRADGGTFPLEIALNTIVTDRERRRVGILRDISEHKAQRELLRHQATHDALTDLPNRLLLGERFAAVIREARENGWSVAFLLLDLDGFREINDTLGHHLGDELLKQIGNRLQTPLDASQMIARLGGDEFAVLLPKIGKAGAWTLARRLCDCLGDFELRNLTLHVSTSIGISMFPEHGLDVSELMQRADVALYQAKNKRSGIAFYDPDRDYNSVRHLTLNSELREAIENDQLMLHFQPKVDIKTGKISSVEALVRWQHPRHGMLPPDEFIGLAEHTGLIIALTRWVVGKALGQSLVWRQQGYDLPVAVNLSARNLQEKDLPEELGVLLESCQLPPDRLILEITESVLMEDPQHSMEILKRLDDLGVRISIDDFGTGYSSLSYLKKLPAHELKIDRSFVMALDSEEDDAVIVRSTIEMAHSLGLTVVAEGIETLQAWNMLKRFHCDYGQGYYFGRPAPADKLDMTLGQTQETEPEPEPEQEVREEEPVAG